MRSATISEDFVADRVAERVVDRLEVVEVGVDDANDVAVPIGVRQRQLHLLLEESAVGQTGERVMKRHVADALLGEHSDR